MSETEEEKREVLLPFAEVYIKEELPDPEDEIEDLEQGCEGNLDNYGAEPDVGNIYEEMVDDCTGHQDEDELGQHQDIEGLRGEDIEIDSDPTVSFFLQDDMRCGICQREYSSAASLKAHLSKKHRLSMGPCFTCHLCGAIGQTKATLKRHLLRTHGQSSLTEHEMLKKCQHCGEGHVTQLALNTHIAEVHTEVLDQYQQCTKCPALFRGRQGLLRHMSRRHPDVDPPCQNQEQCQECQLTFPSRTALRLHLKNHHPETLMHRCQSCSATFKYSSMLRRHVKNTHEKREEQKSQQLKQQRYKCCKCPREYRSKIHLEKHALVHLAPQQPRAYPCPVCGATFSSRSRRSRHNRMVHYDKSRRRCSECHQCFDTTEELDIHRQKHKMKCAVCDKTFLRRDSLREHLLIHNGPKLPCPYCPKKFTQNSNLKRHIRVHTGEKPYKCNFCTRRFGDKSACNSHMRVHTGAERCSCPECGASFSKRQKLNYHMRKHTGEGLLHCPLCTRPATNSYSLKKHVETHQTVLGRLLQGVRVLGQAEECQNLALRTLHNLAWVTARATANDKAVSLHETRITSMVENKVTCKEEINQMPSSDFYKKEVNAEPEISEDVQTPIEHIEVVVKVESPDEMEKSVDSAVENKAGSSSYRQLPSITRKMDVLRDPLEDKDPEHMIEQYDEVKTEVLTYIMNLRCTQFNEAVEKCKLEAAIKEKDGDSLQGQVEINSWKNNDCKLDETKDVPAYKELKLTNNINKNIIDKEDSINFRTSDENTLTIAWKQMTECSSSLMEEPQLVLARLWRLLIEPKEYQYNWIPQFAKGWLKEQNIKMENKNEAPSSVLDLRVESKHENNENITCTKHRFNEEIMDSETSECEDKPS